jgi:hypothetical protein
MQFVSPVGSDSKLDEIMDSKSDPVIIAMRIMCADTGVIRSNKKRNTVYTLTVISGFRRDVSDICALLGY